MKQLKVKKEFRTNYLHELNSKIAREYGNSLFQANAKKFITFIERAYSIDNAIPQKVLTEISRVTKLGFSPELKKIFFIGNSIGGNLEINCFFEVCWDKHKTAFPLENGEFKIPTAATWENEFCHRKATKKEMEYARDILSLINSIINTGVNIYKKLDN